MSDADRARMKRQGDALAAADHEAPGTVEQRRALLDGINTMRAADGSPPFVDEDEEAPELVFHRRARALGMARLDR